VGIFLCNNRKTRQLAKHEGEKMKKILPALLIFASISCTNQPNNPSGSPSPSSGTQIANPASQNCIAKGGKLEIRTNTAGQFGVCVFTDGSECDEWEYYRNTCQIGQKKS
jgi:putative hemolysin